MIYSIFDYICIFYIIGFIKLHLYKYIYIYIAPPAA